MKDLKYYLSLPYEIIVLPISQDEGGGYLARKSQAMKMKK